MKYYILKGEKPVLVDYDKWAGWIHDHVRDRIVAREKVGRRYHVVTIFTGRSTDDENSQVFATTVFASNPEPAHIYRWYNWAEAKDGHRQVVGMVKIRFAIEEEHEI